MLQMQLCWLVAGLLLAMCSVLHACLQQWRGSYCPVVCGVFINAYHTRQYVDQQHLFLRDYFSARAWP